VVRNTDKMPVAGHDYPRTWEAFLDWFPDEAACVYYLERLRWPDGFVCLRCGVADAAYRGSRGRWLCRHCRYQGTVTAGTVFEKTRTPLRSWLAAVWYVTNQKHGVSALGLQRVLGLGSYQTAWTMLHRLRRAMVRHGRERLSGVVEVDEAFLGHVRGKKRGTGKPRPKKQIVGVQTPIAIAVEVKAPKGFGRTRLRRISDVTAESLIPFVQDSVEPGSVVRTDGSWSYHKLSQHGYPRDRNVVSYADHPAHVPLPGVHRVASLLKRWLLGTHHGAVQPHQLDYYLDEFTFRFNRRTSRSRGLLFYRLLEQAVVTDAVSYTEITGQR
jgi:transposase-like protein